MKRIRKIEPESKQDFQADQTHPEVFIPLADLNSLARVMQAIFARGDVAHPDLVKLRKRVIELHKAQKTTVEMRERVSQAQIAFTFLTYIENGFTPKTVLSFGMSKVLRDAKKLSEAMEGNTDGDVQSHPDDDDQE